MALGIGLIFQALGSVQAAFLEKELAFHRRFIPDVVPLFVSGLVSLDVPVAGLLLLATPGEIPGYARKFDLRPGVSTLLIHGWRDEVCPLPGVHAFAARRRLPLLVLDDDHRLGASMDAIAAQFRLLLGQLAASV